MDGVPGISFPGIRPRRDLRLRVPDHPVGHLLVSQPLQPSGGDGPLRSARSSTRRAPIRSPTTASMCWCCRTGVSCIRTKSSTKLKKSPGYFNQSRTTLAGLMSGEDGMSLEERRMWGQMRMDPRDIARRQRHDLHLSDQRPWPEENWTGLFRPGERVRLRIINASAMSIFNVRIPGLADDGGQRRRRERAARSRPTSSRFRSPRPMTSSSGRPRTAPTPSSPKPVDRSGMGAGDPGAAAGHDGRGSAAARGADPDHARHGHGRHGSRSHGPWVTGWITPAMDHGAPARARAGGSTWPGCHGRHEHAQSRERPAGHGGRRRRRHDRHGPRQPPGRAAHGPGGRPSPRARLHRPRVAAAQQGPAAAVADAWKST